MFNKIKSVQTLEDYMLLITFENGVQKYYDIKPLCQKWKIFKDLIITPNLFKNVQVDTGGYGIYWNDDIDLSCNELWENGI